MILKRREIRWLRSVFSDRFAGFGVSELFFGERFCQPSASRRLLIADKLTLCEAAISLSGVLVPSYSWRIATQSGFCRSEAFQSLMFPGESNAEMKKRGSYSGRSASRNCRVIPYICQNSVTLSIANSIAVRGFGFFQSPKTPRQSILSYAAKAGISWLIRCLLQ